MKYQGKVVITKARLALVSPVNVSSGVGTNSKTMKP